MCRREGERGGTDGGRPGRMDRKWEGVGRARVREGGRESRKRGFVKKRGRE